MWRIQAGFNDSSVSYYYYYYYYYYIMQRLTRRVSVMRMTNRRRWTNESVV